MAESILWEGKRGSMQMSTAQAMYWANIVSYGAVGPCRDSDSGTGPALPAPRLEGGRCINQAGC